MKRARACLQPGKGKQCTGDKSGWKMLNDMNNVQHIDSNRIKRLQHNCVVQETLNHCDRITDKTLPILFPMEKVRSEAASIIM